MKSDYGGKERRRHPRREINLEIVYSSLETFFYDYAINISRGGMFIKTDRPLHVGTRVKLKFSLPGRELPVETSGRVVRTVSGKGRMDEPHGMGIEFEDLSEEDHDLIESLWDESVKEVKSR